MAKTTDLLCLWTLMVHASDPLGGLASGSDAPAGRSRTILLANGDVGVRQRVLRQSGVTKVIQELENKTSREQRRHASPEQRRDQRREQRRDAKARLRTLHGDAAKRAAIQSTQLAPLSHRIGWMHMPKSGTSFGTSLAHLANASLPHDAAIGLAPSAQRR